MKKVMTLVLAIALVLSLSVSALAFDGEADIALYVGNSTTWVTAASDPVKVNADGEYTLKLEGLAIDESAVTVVYIKDTAVEAQEATSSNLPADISILTKELKINGSVVELDEGYPTVLTDTGALDICWYNIWATSYFSTLGMKEIKEIEVTFEVVSSGASSETETSSVADTSEQTSQTTENNESSDNAADQTPAETGITLVLLPMAAALAAVVFTKRK